MLCLTLKSFCFPHAYAALTTNATVCCCPGVKKKKLALYVIIAQLAGMFRVLKLKIVAISKVQVIPKGWKLEKIYTTSLLITKVQFKSSLVGRWDANVS